MLKWIIVDIFIVFSSLCKIYIKEFLENILINHIIVCDKRTNLYVYLYQPLRARHLISFSLSRETQHRKHGTCARRYLSDFSKGEMNLNCRSQAIPTSFTFPETRLLSVSLRLSSTRFFFFPAMASSTSWFFVLIHRGSHRERPSRSSFFGERNAADEQRFAEGTRELRSVRLLDVKKLTGSEDRAYLGCTCR